MSTCSGVRKSTPTITTTTAVRSIPAVPTSDKSALAAQLPAADGLLDQIAFSRGRFLVAGGGLPTLVVPAWPEFARVVEDCRAKP